MGKNEIENFSYYHAYKTSRDDYIFKWPKVEIFFRADGQGGRRKEP